jgi:hypothetical protein
MLNFETVEQAQMYLGEDCTLSEAWELVRLSDFYNEVWM